jgi:hypothetical protein
MMRKTRDIAGATMIHGALGFRASLEVSDHRRCEELCGRLLPWLEELGLADLIDPFHREILGTPYRGLPRDLQTEAYWRGESAVVLGWCVHFFDAPDPIAEIGAKVLLDRLKLLRPEANALLATAQLRPTTEIERYCAFCIAVRNRYRSLSVEEQTRVKLDEIHNRWLDEIGINNDNVPLELLVEEASRFVSEFPNARGFYSVRAYAAEWLLGRSG